ncbi:hypothetical protein B0H21DRAFT_705756 [Amylocystis lapponica]|nr:hypothetical protein B0H21DRAFT_705756 [Amylocystis lapponica]
MLAFMTSIPAPFPVASSVSHKRPRGLWKGRKQPPALSRPDADTKTARRSHVRKLSSPDSLLCDDDPDSYSPYVSDRDDDDLDDVHSISSGSSKRPRRSASCHAAPITYQPSPKGKQPSTVEYEDWENLKELFSRAAERYDSDDIAQALPLLRAVIRECHRFLKVHSDPSIIYAESPQHRQSRSPDAMTPTDERLSRDWTRDTDRTLIAGDASLALPGEPTEASAYWLAALDVFETGENLPSRTSGGSDPGEDWRMSIVWGRTLVSLADEKVSHSIALARAQTKSASDEYCYLPHASPFPAAEPTWPADSPFSAIAAVRPPVPRRALLHAAGAHELMVLAMDQFSRGIFHMPHPHYPSSHNPSHIHTPASPVINPHAHQHSPPVRGPTPSHAHAGCPSDPLASFSRPKELFTVASEVLGVAERLPAGPSAHSVFTQMRWEADMDAWRAPLMSARGRCWLVVGGARGEEIERALDRGEQGVLTQPEAEEAREGLAMAISFFERAKGSATSSLTPVEDISPLLAEALLTLANLTADDNKREELYSRAQAEAGERLARELGLSLDSDAMDES